MAGRAEAHTEAEVLDGGPRKTAPGSARYCAATGVVRPVADMIRFVVTPDGTPVADLKRRLPGRGLWITASRTALRSAVARKIFGRGFRRDVRLAPDLVEQTERLIEQSALAALSMVHKAGKVAIGFVRTGEAIAHEDVVALLHAADAAPDGARKLDAALSRRHQGAPGIAVIETFTSAQLDLALGRSNVVHAALLAGRESDTFVARAGLLDRFRAGGPAEPNDLRPAAFLRTTARIPAAETEKQDRNG
ncbi:MAG TPA: RNA-binding protein [Xanthobacteraceae bacterium]|jgi:predicted RNA-binding protein YlxR (DUF448 family)|nr:RNA-binding protein [Xanthobacteraceae bacterium]